MISTSDPHSQWMIERDIQHVAANASGATEHESMEATSKMVDLEVKLLKTPATTFAGSFLRCLAVVKISADGHCVDDAAARAVELEADAFLREQGASRAAFDEAHKDYLDLRAAEEAMPDDADPAVLDRALDAYCHAMDHLIVNVRSPDAAALGIKFALIQERCVDHAGWFDDYLKGFMLDLDHLAVRGTAR